MNTYIIKVFSLIICLGWSSLSYTQDCVPQGDGSTKLEGGKVIISYGATTNAVSPKKASNILLGQTIVGQNNTSKFVADYGFYTQFLLPPLSPTVTASQGELLDRIQVSWALDPLGSSPNQGFNLFRDGVFIENVGPKVRNYNDYNVIAGRPYIYSVAGINEFGDGTLGEGLGFQVPNGIVTGYVQTVNDRPVPDAQVTLLPMQGFSLRFGEEDGAVAIADVGNPFLPNAGEDWSMAFWINLDPSFGINNSNGEARQIGTGDIIISFSDFGLEIEKPLGIDGINIQGLEAEFSSDEWHHVAISFDGIADIARLYIDGTLEEQGEIGAITSPDSIYFGKVIEELGFKGVLDEFRIYHTVLDELDLGMVMEGTASSTTPFLTHYWKFDEELGEKSFDIVNRHQLYFCGAQFDEDHPPVRTAAITDEDGYYRIEGVSYGTGTTFIAEPSKDFYMHRSLEFKGSEQDYVTLPDFALPNQSTIEFWVNPGEEFGFQTILSKKEGSNTFKIYSLISESGTILTVEINGAYEDVGFLSNGFNHVALTIDSTSGEIKGYINGMSPTNSTLTMPSNWSDTTYQWHVGADSDGNVLSDYYSGLIDELAVYDTLLSHATILSHAQNTRTMPEDGLIVYFPMDEGSGNRVNNVGSTLLEYGTIYGPEWSIMAANQVTIPHEFKPKTRQVTLNPSVTSVDQVDFTDLSTIPVSGYVRFQGTDCFQPNVEILVNGESFSPRIFTDSIGKFLVDFDPGFTGDLSPKYEDHTFSPASWEVINVTSPVAGVLFNNTVKRSISGQVAGGLCMLPILNAPGTSQGTICKVKVSTSDECLERIYTFGENEEDGLFEFDNLPPVEKLTIAVIEHSDPAIKSYFEVLGGVELDISKNDTIKDFIYFAPPEIDISGGLNPYSPSCDIIVLEQYSIDSIIIQMQEVYLGQVCVIDTGAIKIINGISDETLDTTISNGSFTYSFKVGEPNPSPPYLKTLQVVGTSLANRESSLSKQAVVTGVRNKENTFTSKLPNVPMLVLRDPPGDGSYAYFEKGETICKTTEIHLNVEGGLGFGSELHLGGDVDIVAAPLGVGTIVNTGAIFDISAEGSFIFGTVSDSSWQTCLTTHERISTSSDDALVGKDSDIFMGTATNIIFGFADMVIFNPNNCEVTDSVVLNVEPESDYASSYIYNRFQIENFLIPNLTDLALAEVDTTLKAEYEYSAAEWIAILAQSDSTVIDADYISCDGCKNISFSAGVEYEYTTTSDTLSSTSSEDTNEQSGEGSITGGYELNSFGFSFTGKSFVGRDESKAIGDESSNSVTTGFVLSDDDPGDAFSVDIGVDEKYKTAVFSLKAGQSSCPWEGGTANREGPNLALAEGSAFSAINVPANEPAVFQFNLGNLSATNEDWTYVFTSIAANNPHGAIAEVNGHDLNGGVEYIVPYGESIPITLSVEKGPVEYDYNNLRVALYSACEYERNLGLGIPIDNNPMFFSDIEISVSFLRPCSEVDINVPRQNWVLYNDVTTPDIMNVTVSGYNLNEPDFKLIRLQYRKENGDGAWINMPGISERYNTNWFDYDAEPDTLSEVFTQFSWDTNGLADGEYEIRAVAVCTGDASDKPGFSQSIKGRIDREPPALFGMPQPSDGVYHVGDEISFTFNQDINCNKLIQADLTQLNNVGLYDATTNDLIDATISCIDNKIIIDPNFQNEFFENRILRAELDSIQDLVGNTTGNLIWEFYVDRNELAWLTDSIELTKYDDETKTIIAKIHNRGGYPVPYTMQSVPDWVHVSPDAGTLVANEIEEIHFTVDETVPLGWLSDSIIMHTETGLNPFFMGGDEVLNMAARVICRPDQWIIDPDGFDPSDYSFSMNFTLALNIEGVLSEDEQDLVGAYVNGQLRGVARLQYNPELDNYLAFLTAYSNIDQGELVEFQIWDASECKLFALILESFTFQADQIKGSPLVPEVIHTDSKVLRKIFIHPGWNWLSMNLDLIDSTVVGALSSLTNPAGGFIKNQVDFSGYSLIQQTWLGDLDSISPLQMYQYNSLAYDSISIVGTLLDPATPIPLVSNWNWIGYIPNEKLSIAEALSSLTSTDGDIIKSQISFAQYVQNFGWIGNLNFMDAPNGYLIKTANIDTLIYPDPQNFRGQVVSGNRFTPPGGSGMTMIDQEERTVLSSYWDVDPTLFEHNMNVIAIVKTHENDANILKDGDELGVFVGDEVRGSSLVSYIPGLDAYMVFMTAYANKEGELLTFKFYDAGKNKVYDIEESTGFVINSILGEVDNPEPLHLSMASGISYAAGNLGTITTYPNPFASSVFVKFHALSSYDDQLVITDALNRIVTTLDVKVKAGDNTLEWRPTSDILPGAYFINLRGNESSQIEKVLYIK